MTTQQEALLHIEELLDLEDGLSVWELKFITDIETRLKVKPNLILTPKQKAKIVEILENKT